MNILAQSSCEACKKSSVSLTNHELDNLLPEIPDWQLCNDNGINKLQKIYTTQSYQQAINLTIAIAKLAELENHHPKITLEYSQVTVQWWTHILNGLHKNDVIMAAKTSEIFKSSL